MFYTSKIQERISIYDIALHAIGWRKKYNSSLAVFSFLKNILVWGHIQLYSGLTPGSMFRVTFEDHLGG